MPAPVPDSRFTSLPLLVGVVGHRDLLVDDIDRLQHAVAEALERLQADLPGTQLFVVSGLTQGAEHLCARVAVRLSLPLVAVCPFPPADFTRLQGMSPDECAEYHALLDRAIRRIEREELREHMPGLERVGETDAAWLAATAGFVAHVSQILLALWDGVEHPRPDDRRHEDGFHTAAIIHARKNGVAAFDACDNPGTLGDRTAGPVVHVFSPHGHVRRPARALETRVLAPRETQDGKSEWEELQCAGGLYAGLWKKPLGKSLKRLDEFNVMWKHEADRLAAPVSSSAEDLWPSPPQGGAPLNERAKEFRRWYARADVLAARTKRGLFGFKNDPARPSASPDDPGLVQALFVLVGIAVLSFEVFAHYLHDWPSVLLIYPIALGLGGALLIFSKMSNREKNFLDYRALAESLRVQFHWSLCGIEGSVGEAYSRLHRTELDWARQALHGLYALVPPAPVAPSVRLFGEVSDRWIERQRMFFGAQAQQNKDEHEALELASNFAFGLSGFVAAVVAVMGIMHPAHGEDHAGAGDAMWITVIGVALACAALVHGYLQKRAYAAIARRYDSIRRVHFQAGLRLGLVLRRARNGVLSEAETGDAQAILRELGRESIAESGDWLLISRDRPLELPKP